MGLGHYHLLVTPPLWGSCTKLIGSAMDMLCYCATTGFADHHYQHLTTMASNLAVSTQVLTQNIISSKLQGGQEPTDDNVAKIARVLHTPYATTD